MTSSTGNPQRVGGLLKLWRRWQAIAHAIGNFQARVLLSLLYFVMVPPFGLITHVTMDPLQLRRQPRKTFWITTAPRASSLADARKQS